jgi:hypothetical protein
LHLGSTLPGPRNGFRERPGIQRRVRKGRAHSAERRAEARADSPAAP